MGGSIRQSGARRRRPHHLARQDDGPAAPEGEMWAAEIAEAIARLKELRRTFGKAPLDEVLASRHEGHKY